MASRARRGRFTVLLAALVVFFLAIPLAIGGPGPLRLVAVLFGLVLVVAAWAVGRTRWRLALTFGLGVPALAARVLDLAAPDVVQPAAPAMTAVFLLFVVVVILIEVLRPAPVDGDKIAGAVCVYLLLGLLWSTLYSLVAALDPAAFSLPAEAERDYAGFLYYSFVTLTTLGYGDILPLSPMARTLSWMEAALGQLFLAVTVATLVALRVGGTGGGRS